MLIVLAEQLGNFVPYVGGAEYAHSLISPLEELANTEEAVVRGKATEGLKTIAENMTPEQASRYLLAPISRLAAYFSIFSTKQLIN